MRPGKMTVYRLRSFGSDRKLIAVQKLSAATDDEAVATAREMVASASAVSAFDLYEDERRIAGAAPTARGQKKLRR
jgi:hypothetical protein